MKFLSYLFLVILLITPKSFAKDGFGPLKFSSNTYQSFIEYLTGDYVPVQTGVLQGKGGRPLGFAINQEGDTSNFYYCPRKYGDNCMPGAQIDAQNKCTQRSKKKGKGRCFVFAKGRVIVWDDLSIKIPRKPTREQIKKIFSEQGWY